MSDGGGHPRENVYGALWDSGSDKAPSVSSPVATSARVRNLARRTKQKTKNVLNREKTPDSELESGSEEGDLFADPAFSPTIVLNGKRAQSSSFSVSNTKTKLAAAGNVVAHPRRTIRNKVTKTAAGKISTVQRPFLSDDNDRDLLAAYDELSEVVSSQSSAPGAETPGWESDEYNARKKVEKAEDARENAKIAWTVGRHVRRVRVIEKMPHRPRKQQFVEEDPAGQEKVRWDIWVAKLALYYTQGFTAQYIDDFEELPFDIEDLARIVERISLTSAPWQAWLIDVRRVYSWEDPKRTSKWMGLFWALWYTEHIMGFLYAYIIYMVLRNWFYPDSVEAVRQAYARSVDQTLKAQAWGELVEKAGHEDWVEPLLDALGPVIQLQLADAADYLEILTNFYKWASPRKTAASLWFFSVCLLITLVADMAFCVKIVWFIVGGFFFFTCPIATRFPQYRRLVSGWRWFVWDIPTDAEWSIRKLQEKALVRQADVLSMGKRPMNERRHSGSPSDYSTPESSRSRLPARTSQASWRFRIYQGSKSGSLVITRKALVVKLGPTPRRIPFARLKEMRKTQAAKKIKARALKPDLESIELCYMDEEDLEQCELLSMAEDIRHEIFNLVLGISGLRWRTLQIERHNKAGDAGKSHLDRIFK